MWICINGRGDAGRWQRKVDRDGGRRPAVKAADMSADGGRRPAVKAADISADGGGRPADDSDITAEGAAHARNR